MASQTSEKLPTRLSSMAARLGEMVRVGCGPVRLAGRAAAFDEGRVQDPLAIRWRREVRQRATAVAAGIPVLQHDGPARRRAPCRTPPELARLRDRPGQLPGRHCDAHAALNHGGGCVDGHWFSSQLRMSLRYRNLRMRKNRLRAGAWCRISPLGEVQRSAPRPQQRGRLIVAQLGRGRVKPASSPHGRHQLGHAGDPARIQPELRRAPAAPGADAVVAAATSPTSESRISVGCAVAHLSVDEHSHRVGPRQGEVDVVGGDHDRGVRLPADAPVRDHLLDALRIQAGGRFIEQDHAGLHRQSAGDRDPLALPEREFMDRALGQILDGEHLQGVGDPFAAPRLGKTEVHRAERHVAGDVRGEQLVVRVLRDQLDDLTVGLQSGARVGDVNPVHEHAAGMGTHRAGQGAQ